VYERNIIRPTGRRLHTDVGMLNARTEEPTLEAPTMTRHHTLEEKLTQLDIPDNICNFFSFNGGLHPTSYRGESSTLLEISASIIQVLAITLPSYDIDAADLPVTTAGNSLCKYADDIYVMIPDSDIDARMAELGNIETWAQAIWR